jgi:hypothetical protein
MGGDDPGRARLAVSELGVLVKIAAPADEVLFDRSQVRFNRALE